jgi:hypothetical protein
MSDATHGNVLHPVFRRPRLVPDCKGERQLGVDPNDIILADLEMLVAKSEALVGIQRTVDTLPDRLLLVMAARSLSRK